MNLSGPRNPQAGFTLVELLVSLALTAAIVSFILGAFHLARRTWAITYDRESTDEIDAAATRLRGLLAKAMPVKTIDEADRIARLLFEGRTDDVIFVTLSEATALQGGPMRVRLSWQDRPPRPGHPAALVLRTAVFRADPSLVFESDPVILFRDVVGFSLRYFGAPAHDQQREWHTEWLGHERMPLAMLVQVDFGAASGRRTLVLQTALRLAPMN
jgi:prepilin-type N-terminal cleavage/methylation domain-containing protein